MKLHETTTLTFVTDEDQLTLQLSEPNFTIYQRIWQWFRKFGFYCLALVK